MGAVYAACAKQARACVKKPGRAMESRLESIARAADVAGQQCVGLAGEPPWVSAEPRQSPRPGIA
eukprot:11007877-Alexandrium_andersonii.AAC.1